MLTTHVELLDRILGYSGQSGLAEFAPAQRVTSKFPPRPGAIAYIEAETLGRMLFEAVKTQQVRKSIVDLIDAWPSIKRAAPDLAKAIASDKLPDFEQVKQHFKASGGAFFTVEEEAVRLSVFTVK
jgi:hypothetical protein